MTVPVTVNGVTGYYSTDVTSSTTQAEFQKAIDALISVGNSTGDLSFATFTKFNQTLADLHQMVSGIDPATGQPLNPPITAAMAQAVSTIFNFVGVFNPGGYQIGSDAQLTLWRDLYFQGIQSNLMAFASTGTVGDRTLQSYIQLEYVQQGNQVLFNQMSQLQQAMQLVNTSLQLLGQLQDLKNKALAPSGSQITNPNWAQPAKPIAAASVVGSYKNATQKYLQQPLLVTVDPNFVNQIQTEGASLITQLNQTVAALNNVNPSGASDPQSLQSKLTQIVTDMSSSPPATNQIVWWVLDNYDNRVDPASMGNLFGSSPSFNTALAGNFGRNLNIAVTTAENFNSSQNIQLKSTLFSFQSFYSSASSLLRAINSIITKMAGGTKG